MIQALVDQRCSQAQARQRWGRVGRTKPGVAIRLYTKEEYENFQEYPDPDLINSNCIPLLLEITEMMEKKNKYSELLPEIYQNNYNIKSLENLMVKSADFFVTPIKQNYFDNAKNILKKLECLDEEENFTLNFYLIREIFFIIKNIDKKKSFSIFDAKMILESLVLDCVDEIIEIIVCCKYLNFGLANVFDPESDEQKILRLKKKNKTKIIKKKALIKKYKKFIDEESDHLTIFNLYQNYKQNPNPKKKKFDIEVNAFSKTQEKLQNYSLIKIFMYTFKKMCKENKKSYPKSLEGLNSNDYLQKIQEIFLDKKNLKNNLKDYQKSISDTLKKITRENKKIFEKQDIKIDLKAKSDDIDLMQIQKILNIILNKKNLPLKDQIISKLTQVFNNELQNDNNKVFKKITNILYLIDKYEEDKNSINTKVLYALYQNNKLEEHKDSNKIGLVEVGIDESDPSKDSRMRDINSKKEIIKHSNDVKTNIIRCILAGYSVHLCQNQKKKEEEEEEQVGGGWWPFSSGKADMEITDENYINCFPKISTKLTTMFQENKDNTYVNFKNSNKKYIIYDTLTTIKNWKNPENPHYIANIITIIPEQMVFEVKTISENGECDVQPRVR
jgi:HrpA-like RNA helicase